MDANDMPVKDVLDFTEYVEEVTEEHRAMLSNAVAEGVAEALEALFDD